MTNIFLVLWSATLPAAASDDSWFQGIWRADLPASIASNVDFADWPHHLQSLFRENLSSYFWTINGETITVHGEGLESVAARFLLAAIESDKFDLSIKGEWAIRMRVETSTDGFCAYPLTEPDHERVCFSRVEHATP